MAEKNLNARILLKYDTYDNCVANNPLLKQGEIIFSTVATNTGNIQNAPSVLIKVGDGTHRYNDLQFVSALAADVIAACKSETTLTTFINNVIAAAGIPSDTVISALSGRVTALETKVGADTVSKQIQDAITALNLDTTYAAKTHTHAISEVTGLQTTLDAKAAASDVTALTTKVTTLIGADASKSVRTIAAEETAKIVAGADAAYDTLKEVADWIKSDTTGAAKMQSDIADLKADTHTHDNKNLLDTYTQTEANLADAVAKKHEHANATVLNGITSAKVAAWDAAAGGASLADIATSGNVNDLIQTAGDLVIINCGSSSVNV